MLEHDPLATAETCEACRVGLHLPYDHEAVSKARPPDFDAQVIAMVRDVANGATSLEGVALGDGVGEMARAWLSERKL